MVTVQEHVKSYDAKQIIYISGQYEVHMNEFGIRHNLEDGVWTLLAGHTKIDFVMVNRYLRFDNISFEYTGVVTIR